MTTDTRRLARPRWFDLRLWLGVGLLAVAMVAGAAILSRSGDTVMVLRAARDLAAGSSMLDAEPVAVPRDLAAGYATSADVAIDGQRLRWPVPAGALVPRAALGAAAGDDHRLVTVPVDPVRAPVGLAPGDVVDVWATAKSTADSAAAVPELVLSGVSVVDLSVDASAISADLGVVLDVAAGEVGSLVLAARSGVVDLAAVPLSAQAPR